MWTCEDNFLCLAVLFFCCVPTFGLGCYLVYFCFWLPARLATVTSPDDPRCLWQSRGRRDILLDFGFHGEPLHHHMPNMGSNCTNKIECLIALDHDDTNDLAWCTWSSVYYLQKILNQGLVSGMVSLIWRANKAGKHAQFSFVSRWTILALHGDWMCSK